MSVLPFFLHSEIARKTSLFSGIVFEKSAPQLAYNFVGLGGFSAKETRASDTVMESVDENDCDRVH